MAKPGKSSSGERAKPPPKTSISIRIGYMKKTNRLKKNVPRIPGYLRQSSIKNARKMAATKASTQHSSADSRKGNRRDDLDSIFHKKRKFTNKKGSEREGERGRGNCGYQILRKNWFFSSSFRVFLLEALVFVGEKPEEQDR